MKNGRVKLIVGSKQGTYNKYLEWKKTDSFRRWKRKQFLKQGGLCWYCDCYLPFTRVNVEHKTAISLGGKNNKNNLVLACSSCNKAKGSKHLSSTDRQNLNHKNRNRRGTYLKNKQFYEQAREENIIDTLKNF